MTHQTERRSPWSQAEDDYLSELIGDYPPELLYAHFRRWARNRGLPLRSNRAIRSRVYQHHRGSLVPIGIYVRAIDLSQQLRRNLDTVTDWIKAGQVPSRYVTRSTVGFCLRREGVRHLARHFPHLFVNVPADELFLLLEDEDLVQQVLTANQHNHGFRVPLICLTTGRRFPSIQAAAAAYHVDAANLARATRSSEPATVCDLQWKRAA